MTIQTQKLVEMCDATKKAKKKVLGSSSFILLDSLSYLSLVGSDMDFSQTGKVRIVKGLLT